MEITKVLSDKTHILVYFGEAKSVYLNTETGEANFEGIARNYASKYLAKAYKVANGK